MRRALAAGLAALLAACAQMPWPRGDATPPGPRAEAAGAAAPSVIALASQPAERALLDGVQAYNHGQYVQAERRLQAALKAGLGSPLDRAAAHKTLAFLHCSNRRVKACEEDFRAARAADPDFELSKAEAGHPLWGPVYRRVLGAP